jgi:hypothetical protein
MRWDGFGRNCAELHRQAVQSAHVLSRDEEQHPFAVFGQNRAATGKPLPVEVWLDRRVDVLLRLDVGFQYSAA